MHVKLTTGEEEEKIATRWRQLISEPCSGNWKAYSFRLLYELCCLPSRVEISLKFQRRQQKFEDTMVELADAISTITALTKELSEHQVREGTYSMEHSNAVLRPGSVERREKQLYVLISYLSNNFVSE